MTPPLTPEQVAEGMRLRAAYHAFDATDRNGSGDWKAAASAYQKWKRKYGGELLAAHVSTAAALAAAEARASADREDAERYRWLRDVGDGTFTALSKRPGGLTAAGVDDCIDRAAQTPPVDAGHFASIWA